MISDLLESLPDQHRRALQWFEAHAGQETAWPGRLDSETLLATKAKGIYKPAWSTYALSIRQTLTGPYPDKEVEYRGDGTWSYAYFQEDLDPAKRDDLYTNQGLLNCYRDVVPVGAMIQTRGKPNVRYRILGLAFINGWGDGFFHLEGIAPTARDVIRATTPPSSATARADAIGEVFDPSRIEDERKRSLVLVRQRQGQAGFRRVLLDAYSRQCAVSAYEAEEALEAAHIVAYRGPVTNHPTNGLLLRADLHSLFDLGLIAFDEGTRLLMHGDLRTTSYRTYAGRVLQLPSQDGLRPSREALREQRRQSGL